MFKKIFIVLLLSFVSFVYVGCENKSSSANIVKDKRTNLMWQDNDDAKSIKKDWDNARKYCANLTLGGYDDWRLPSIEELRSLVDYSLYRPAINLPFKNAADGASYWSSTSNANNSSYAWIVNFEYGHVYRISKSYVDFVRCVR